MKNTYHIKAKVWRYKGSSGWHFVTLPEGISSMIREFFRPLARRWGSLPVKIDMGRTSWETSIFFDTKSDAYILPLKADIRKKEGIIADQIIEFDLKVRE